MKLCIAHTLGADLSGWAEVAESIGVEWVGCPDHPESLDALKSDTSSSAFDLLILDESLGEVSSLRLLRAIAECKLPVLVVAPGQEQPQLERYYKEGAALCMSERISATDLQAALEEVATPNIEEFSGDLPC